MKYKAYRVFETTEDQFSGEIKEMDTEDLPEGEVLVQVLFSSLNYKDALSATGNKGVTRSYPHTPGIDAVGIVKQSRSERIRIGQKVIVSGFDLGMNTDGGFGQFIRVPEDWVIFLPDGLTPIESMIFGTAGFTAALSIKEILASDIVAGKAPILVTGATGGVGSMAVMLLAHLGFEVVAVTGKRERWDWLKDLGANQILSREMFLENNKRPLLKQKWGGVVDTVGGEYLETALKAACYGCHVTCCGLVASEKLEMTVFPFILRAVSLIGIDSVNVERQKRTKVWQKLANEWKPKNLDSLKNEVTLENIQTEIDKILSGNQTGRVVISHQNIGNEQ
ncbi:MAG: oxidoreductase [Anaerolineaceae bacterium]|nr:oxidoreductase [Anaerolineaceae bacterium]